MRGDCLHLRRRRGPAGLPRRSGRLAPVPVPHPDRDDRAPRTATTSPIPPRCRPNWAAPRGWPGLSRRRASRGMGLIVDIVPNHVGVDDPRAERVVVGRPDARHETRAYSSFFDIDWTLDRRPNRVAGAGFRRRRRRPRRRRRRAAARRPRVSHRAGNRFGHRPRGPRPPALHADRVAQRGVRLPAVLLDHLAGRSAPGGPRGLRRHPRRGEALVRRRTGRRRPHRPSGRIGRPGRLSDLAAGDHRAAGVDRHREDPRGRRAARPEPARGGHHRLRRTARDRRPVRRSRRARDRSPPWSTPPGVDYDEMPQTGARH